MVLIAHIMLAVNTVSEILTTRSMQVMVVLEHFPKEDLRKFLVQMGRRYVLYTLSAIIMRNVINMDLGHEKNSPVMYYFKVLQLIIIISNTYVLQYHSA